MASTSSNLSGVNNSDVIIHLIDDAIDGIDYTISNTAFIAANNPKYAIWYNTITLYDNPKVCIKSTLQNHLNGYYALLFCIHIGR